MRELHRLAVGQKLDVNLPRTEERALPADERQHAAVRRKRRRRGGVGEVGELRVLAAGRFGGLPESGHEQRARSHERRRRSPRPPPATVARAWTTASRAPAALPRSAASAAGDRRPCRASTGSGPRDPSPAPSRRPSAAAAARPPAAAPAAPWMIACRTSRSVAPGERPPPGQQLVQHDAEREDVAARVERLSRRLLRRHVRDGADDDARARARLGQRASGIVRRRALREVSPGRSPPAWRSRSS